MRQRPNRKSGEIRGWKVVCYGLQKALCRGEMGVGRTRESRSRLKEPDFPGKS